MCLEQTEGRLREEYFISDRLSLLRLGAGKYRRKVENTTRFKELQVSCFGLSGEDMRTMRTSLHAAKRVEAPCAVTEKHSDMATNHCDS